MVDRLLSRFYSGLLAQVEAGADDVRSGCSSHVAGDSMLSAEGLSVPIVTFDFGRQAASEESGTETIALQVRLLLDGIWKCTTLAQVATARCFSFDRENFSAQALTGKECRAFKVRQALVP